MTSAQTLRYFHQQLPILGVIQAIGFSQSGETGAAQPSGANAPAADDPPNPTWLDVATRSGAVFHVEIRATTWFQALRNLDGLDRRRSRQGGNWQVGDLVAVDGIYSRHGDQEAYDALAVTELMGSRDYYLFEHTFWWKDQINVMANRWLDNLFGERALYTVDDYAAFYRTSLNIQGQPVQQDGDTQEMATLSRLIYGFSSAYLLTGEERFLHAASAGVAYQREAFRSISADGRFCFWLHARKRDREGRIDLLPSQNAEDRGTIPLYEQIYALAGLAMYYRISNDWEVLHDIQRSITSFNTFFADRRPASGADPADGQRHDGFFSHIDPVRFSWDAPELDANPDERKRGQKNWNSIGDHLPAYLVNLILALDPLPQLDPADPDASAFQADLERFLASCREILDVTADKIASHFPQSGNAYVMERFTRDWQPITDYGWQQNRAVVGHNLKIVWNLTRVVHYYRLQGKPALAERLAAVARQLGEAMAERGTDPIRGGVYDAVERQPRNGLPVQFSWLNTRDFWQQEQGILAYLVLFGLEAQAASSSSAAKADPAGSSSDAAEPGGAAAPALPASAEHWLRLARELQAYWNLNFLDHDRRGVFFRVSDNGQPVIRGSYADKGGHSISGYHVFELALLAQVYQRAYLPREKQEHTGLTLHFLPSPHSRLRSINVLPDYLGAGQLKITEVQVDGVSRYRESRDGPASGALARGQVSLHPSDLGRRLSVSFQQADSYHRASRGWAVRDGRPF